MAKDFMAAFLKERNSQAVSNLDTAKITLLAVNTLSGDSSNFYSMNDIDDLVESIREHGLIHPIVTNNGFMVISGHRRLAAYRRLLEETGDEKYKMIPCIVRHPADWIESEMMLIEANSTARILTSYELMEQARRYSDLLEKAKGYGYDYEGRRRDIVAKMMNVSPAKVGRLNAINKHLVAPWVLQFQNGDISESVAYEISKLSEDDQERLLNSFLDDTGKASITLDDIKRLREPLSIEKKKETRKPKLQKEPIVFGIRGKRERLTHERANGMKSGYWSPAKKEELIQRLAEYEEAEDRGNHQ